MTANASLSLRLLKTENGRKFSPMKIFHLAIAAALAVPLAAQKAPVPTPASILGYEPGADRHLPSWKQVTDYFRAVERASPRVQVHTLGQTVLGRPFLAVFISDSATLRHLDRYQMIQRKLMNP